MTLRCLDGPVVHPSLPKDPWWRPSLSSSGWSCRDRPPAGFVWQRLQLLWGDAGRTIAGSRGESTLSSAGSRRTVPQSGCPGPRPRQPWARLPGAPRPRQRSAVSVLDFGRSDRGVAESRRFSLHSADGICEAPFRGRVASVLLGEVSVQVFCPCFNWVGFLSVAL